MTLPKDHVRKQVEFMQKNPKIGIGKANYSLLSEENLIAALEIIPFVVFESRNGSLDSKLPGTGGAIYRVEAIRGVGGFDNSLRQGAEDTDAAYRVKGAGWLISRSPAVFYEKGRQTWRELWRQYFQHGYALFALYRRNRQILSIYRMNAIAGFLNGVFYTIDAYRVMGRRAAFLLPLHFAIKMTAWSAGFSRGARALHEN
jgi:cellulose synthase/poly-beta-1,6-N-acetylglucosamine synthase-like glycosyltransferase